MVLSEYINNLTEFLKEHGDLNVVYSVDEEGNSFNQVCFPPTVGYFDDCDFVSTDNFDEGSYEINSICIN